jgi:hypothetical protein
MKEQALAVGDVAAHLLDGVPLCGVKSSAFLTGMQGKKGKKSYINTIIDQFHTLLKLLANQLEPSVGLSQLAIHIMRCWSIAYLLLCLGRVYSFFD